MTNENIKLEELEELRETFQMMDEKLDSQEIVTPEQIRTATMEKVGLLETELKSMLIWGFVTGCPLLTLFFQFTGGLSKAAWWTAGIFCFISIAISLFLLRKVSRKDIVDLDLATLMTREKRYRRTYLILVAMTLVFWTVFAYAFLSLTVGITYTVFFGLIFIPKYYQSFIRAYREGLQGKVDEKPTLLRRIGQVAGFVMISICVLVLFAFFVLNVIAFFKLNTDLSFKSIDWLNLITPIAILSAVIGFIPLIINMVRKTKTQGLPTVSIVGLSIFTVLFIGIFIYKYFAEGDKGIFPSLIMLILPIWIIYNSYKNKQ